MDYIEHFPGSFQVGFSVLTISVSVQYYLEKHYLGIKIPCKRSVKLFL